MKTRRGPRVPIVLDDGLTLGTTAIPSPVHGDADNECIATVEIAFRISLPTSVKVGDQIEVLAINDRLEFISGGRRLATEAFELFPQLAFCLGVGIEYVGDVRNVEDQYVLVSLSRR